MNREYPGKVEVPGSKTMHQWVEFALATPLPPARDGQVHKAP